MNDSPTDDSPTSPPTDAEDTTSTRQCGRCRLRFPIDAGTHPMELRDWWACPACMGALLPDRR